MSAPLFDEPSFDAAVQAARSSGKWVVIDFTASWCAPCRAMESTVWPDERLAAWMKANAHGVSVDIDAHEELAQRFGIRAVPSVVVLKDDQIVDRFTGGRSASDVLTFFDGVTRGETELRRLQANVREHDVEGRSQVARSLSVAGMWEEAAKAYVWLWKNALGVDEAWRGVRHSYWLTEMAQLVEAHPRASSIFETLRAEARTNADTDADALGDWLALNATLGHVVESLIWFDALPELPKDAKTLWVIERQLGDELKAVGRWKDIARFHPDPLESVSKAFAMYEHTAKNPPGPAEMHQELLEFMANTFRTTCTDLYIALLAAERNDEAEALRAKACELDPSDEMAHAFEHAADP